RATYNAALARFQQAYAGDNFADGSVYPFVIATGLLSDELQPNHGYSFGGDANVHPGTSLDRRDLPELIEGAVLSSSYAGGATYSGLQRTRGQAREALGLLRDYAPDLPTDLRGHLLAIIGYSEIYLADLYCSGIPLSTVDYAGNYTLAAGSSTVQVYEHAVALFDSALTQT